MKKKRKMNWKKPWVSFLAVSLLVPGLFVLDGHNKAEGASYNKIVEVKVEEGSAFSNVYWYNIKTQDGTIYSMDGKDVYAINDANTQKVVHKGDYFLDKDGYIWKKGSPNTKLSTSKFKDIIFTNTSGNDNYPTYYALGVDGTVSAWGNGTSGELGTGYKQDRTTPDYVVDPSTVDTPLTGVKKIFRLGRVSTLLVTDNSVYLIGVAFGQSTTSTAKPVKLTIFPAFTSADNFDMKMIDNVDRSRDQAIVRDGYQTAFHSELRYFIINGKEYTLSDLNVLDTTRRDYTNDVQAPEVNKTTLIPWNEAFPLSSVSAFNFSKVQLSGSTWTNKEQLYQGYVSLYNGNLVYWGTDASYWTYGMPPFSSTKKQIDTGVKKVVADYNTGTFWYLKNNGRVYAFGANKLDTAGVTGTLNAPTRITGPNGEVDGIVDIAFKPGYPNPHLIALKDDGTMVAWSFTTFRTVVDYNTKKPIQAIGLLNPKGGNGYPDAFVLGKDGYLYNTSWSSSSTGLTTVNKVYGLPFNLAPDYYVPPVTLPMPTHSVATDKYQQATITLDYGSDAAVTKKEYSLDNGATWNAYSGPFGLGKTGDVTIQARGGDESGNYSDIDTFTVTNNPIVIQAGYPKITFSKDDGTGKYLATVDPGTSDPRVKVQANLNSGGWDNYTGPLTLSEGNNTVMARLLNADSIELGSASETYQVNTAPVSLDKPQITQGSLDQDFNIPVNITYDASQGEMYYAVDGGSWTKYDSAEAVKVTNESHAVDAKVIAAGGTESETATYSVLPTEPVVSVDGQYQVVIDVNHFPNSGDISVRYGTNGSADTDYTGPIGGLADGSYNLVVQLTNKVSTATWSKTYPIQIGSGTTNPGNGGTTPDPGAGTPVGQEDVDFTVNSGGLSARFEGADLSTIIIDSTNPYQSINSVSRALIDDSRGNGKGYQYSMDVTDFVSEAMQDNSTNTQSLVVSIPASALSVDVLSTKTINGPAAELSNVGKHVFTGNGPEMLATAKAFEGMGYNEIPLNFTLSVPDRVKIVSSGAGSKFVPGESTGLMAGIYKSKFTLTLSSGI
ncbi:hypothetical protein [Paenibacillus sp. Y412MC10]|uniref:hypothetical protein n=1 Tax=Geobacillus sp. (strain Y412MC10) TaxID=481743 RepID=UPI0011A2999F|nr:hypothetical protein [Paenibacillus sp. Y412MC10]